ncbi:MAG: conjugal transfer protein TraB, partial [Hafnia sp.]
YYIKRAEQYHPIIPIGAGTEVTVVFQKGFQLAFIEDSQKKTVKQQVGQAVNSGIQVSQQTLNELKLGDYVAPQASANIGGQP